VIPASERMKVRKFCDKATINAFTLFDSEEGLLEKQVMSVIDLRSNVTSRWRTGSPLLFESYQSE
jgi:hypothetical protein